MSTEQLLFAAAVLTAVTALTLGAARRLKFGSIAALLLVGVVLGPHSPHPLITSHVSDMQTIGEIGVMLLVFLVGLETQPHRFWSMRSMVFGFGTLSYLASSAVIAALLLASAHVNWQSALVIGLGLAMSSSAIPLATLAARGELNSVHGRLTVAADILQSLMLVPLLAMIPLLGRRAAAGQKPNALALLEVVVALAALLLLARVVLPFWLRRIAAASNANFTLVVLAGVLAGAWATEHVGLSMAFGAFVTGLLLSTSPLASRVKTAVSPAREALLGVFFVATGMAIDPHEAAKFHGELLFYVSTVLLIKVAVIFLAARAFRIAPRDAWRVSLLLMPLDELGYAVFGSARLSGLLSPQGYALALLSISFSFLVSPLAINLGFPRAANPTPAATPTLPQRDSTVSPPD